VRRKRKKLLIIVASCVGAVLVLITIAIVVFVLTMPDSPSLDAGTAEQQEIPESWLASTSPSTPSMPSPDVAIVPQIVIEPQVLPYPLSVFPVQGQPFDSTLDRPEQAVWAPSSGLLRMASDGKPFGQERYVIRIEGDAVHLTTTGEFFFKVVLVTVRISFEQELVIGRDGRPRSYRLATYAPLGQDIVVEAVFADGVVELLANEEVTSQPVSLDTTIIIGTFSSYALLPAILAAKGLPGGSFDVLLFGGPPGTAQGSEEGILPQMSVSDRATAAITSGDLALDVEVYEIDGPFSSGALYAREGEILGMTFVSDDGTIDVWRNDYFAEPIVSASASPQP